jgi:PPIC-type PPIASE domain
MAWHRKRLSLILAGLGCWLTTGCADLPEFARYEHSPALDISQPATPTVRSQVSDGAGIKLQNPMPAQTPPPAFIPPPPPDKEIVQTVAMPSQGKVCISIRAWVNGQPIFDEEVREKARGAINEVLKLPEPQRSEQLKELMNKSLEQIIDYEVMYQDAIKRLNQAGGKSLGKLKEFVDQEFSKTLKRMRDKGVPESYISSIEPIARRMMERELVAGEYARTLIKEQTERISPDDIREYYEDHKNNFVTVDRVEWQDIFIRVNANKNLPTIDDAVRFGEELVHKCRTAEDFNKLKVYNEGVTVNTGSEGLGNLRGQIQPRELEEALFKLREGEIGPVIPLTTGVHLIRVTKREYAGQKPLDYAVQKTIRKKLEGERFEREIQRLVRELRDRATVRREAEVP